MADLHAMDRWLETNLDQSLDELKRLVAQPSVVAQKLGIEPCADLVASMLRARGFATEVLPTGGSPVVVAERGGRSDKTLVIYNHYDVQPPEPLELWTSPPFEATLRDGKLYGRGVSDDKGHLVARLHAMDAILASAGELPCRIKFVIEGEEEVGSVHMPAFLAREKDRLRGDACLWEFGYVDPDERPLLHAGLRGICYVELRVRTAAHDAHSGIGGSIFPNAAWRLTWALATLKGPDERIRIPGHYDKVRAPSARDRELMAETKDRTGEFRELYGVQSFIRGLEGEDLKIAEVFEPTCTICGITAGYQGPGSKTVLPAYASAKVDFRLVPDMMPEDVFRSLRAHLDAQGFHDVEAVLLGGTGPGRTDPDHPFLALVSRTAEPVYGVTSQIVPMIGGSGPTHSFIHILGLPIATAGMGYADTRAHAPDENLRVDHYLKHAKHVVRILEAFAQS
ncbi:MAG TPA: M20/M25/M40 family metallo-hydrolase [Candidatus Eisenbacteria bacterium]|nr:M20/M25/M40 family metallo-hydrolase [Candidatus Eisenbacteria bacterium]